MAKVKYYAKENSTIGTHSFYAVAIATKAEIESGAACGQLAIVCEG